MKKILLLLGLVMTLFMGTGCAFKDMLNEKTTEIDNIQTVKDLTSSALDVVVAYQNGTTLTAADATTLDTFITKLDAELSNTTGTIYNIVSTKTTGYTNLSAHLDSIEAAINDMDQNKTSDQVKAIQSAFPALKTDIASLRTKFSSVAGI